MIASCSFSVMRSSQSIERFLARSRKHRHSPPILTNPLRSQSYPIGKATPESQFNCQHLTPPLIPSDDQQVAVLILRSTIGRVDCRLSRMGSETVNCSVGRSYANASIAAMASCNLR